MAEGMAINVDESPWRAFDFWKSQPLQKGHFASLRGFIASLVLRSVDLPNRFANRFWENIEFPPAVHPEMRCFLRHPLGVTCSSLANTVQDHGRERYLRMALRFKVE